jgi:hypothetical protein
VRITVLATSHTRDTRISRFLVHVPLRSPLASAARSGRTHGAAALGIIPRNECSRAAALPLDDYWAQYGRRHARRASEDLLGWRSDALSGKRLREITAKAIPDGSSSGSPLLSVTDQTCFIGKMMEVCDLVS